MSIFFFAKGLTITLDKRDQDCILSCSKCVISRITADYIYSEPSHVTLYCRILSLGSIKRCGPNKSNPYLPKRTSFPPFSSSFHFVVSSSYEAQLNFVYSFLKLYYLNGYVKLMPSVPRIPSKSDV